MGSGLVQFRKYFSACVVKKLYCVLRERGEVSWPASTCRLPYFPAKHGDGDEVEKIPRTGLGKSLCARNWNRTFFEFFFHTSSGRFYWSTSDKESLFGV